jgi:predicted transcriptional regulator
MNTEDQGAATDLVGLTADVVSAYLSQNQVQVSEIPALIDGVHAAFVRLGSPAAPEPVRPEPPVPIRKTITPDAIISLEDGKPYKTLKRHLTGRGLTPQQYREKWGLPADYPMAAPNYSAKRSELAKAIGLGANRRGAAAAAAAEEAPAEEEAPKRRGRRKATAE